MMKFRGIVSIAVGIALIFMAQANQADAGAREKPGKGLHACVAKKGVHRGGYIHSYLSMYKDHAKELGLSAEQQEKLAALDAECTKSCDKLSEQIAAVESELDKLVKADTLDMSAVSAKVKEAHDLKSQLELGHFELLAKAQQILTSEQREKCRSLCDVKKGKQKHMVH